MHNKLQHSELPHCVRTENCLTLGEKKIMVAAVTTREDGFAEMAYVGEKPWHGLGQELTANAPIETWVQQAGMEWKIKRGVVRYATTRNDDLGLMNLPDQHVLFRSDTKKPLGIVSSKYLVVQPSEVLEFFRDLTNANGYTLNTAGTLFDGRKFWALASIGESACVIGDDKIEGFLLLSSSCDGTLATTARFTTVRVVCNNTLNTALKKEAKHEVVVRHSTTFDAEAAKKNLGLARDNFGTFLKASRRLAAKSVSKTDAATFIEKLLRDTKMITAQDITKSTPYTRILELFNTSAMGGTLVSAEGTAWGMVNAVTEYVDHYAKATNDSNRIASAWFGRGDALKTQALEQALAIVS